MSDPTRFVFDLDDIANRAYYPVLNAFLELWVRGVFVEFLQQGGQKPHVILRLLTHGSIDSVDRSNRRVRLGGCRISMDYIGGQGDVGELTVTLTPYNNASLSAGAGFRFPLQENLRVCDLIAILQGVFTGLPPRLPGLPVNHQSDLTLFNFVLADPVTQSVDGCRDVVSQWVIRLNTIGIVAWTADLQSVERIVFNWNPPSYDFHSLIGLNYIITEHRDRSHNRIVFITPLHLDRGVFLDSRVQRIENHAGCQLPYNPPRER